MNPAIHAALIASAARKEEASKAILQQFRSKQAFGPTNAIVVDIDGDAQQQSLDELQGLGVVRAVGNGRYYLDRERQSERQREQGRIALIVTLGALSIIASAVALLALT